LLSPALLVVINSRSMVGVSGVSVKTKRGAGDGDEVEEELRGGVVCFLVRSEMCDD
jgi:hypothetical protein